MYGNKCPMADVSRIFPVPCISLTSLNTRNSTSQARLSVAALLGPKMEQEVAQPHDQRGKAILAA